MRTLSSLSSQYPPMDIGIYALANAGLAEDLPRSIQSERTEIFNLEVEIALCRAQVHALVGAGEGAVAALSRLRVPEPVVIPNGRYEEPVEQSLSSGAQHTEDATIGYLVAQGGFPADSRRLLSATHRVNTLESVFKETPIADSLGRAELTRQLDVLEKEADSLHVVLQETPFHADVNTLHRLEEQRKSLEALYALLREILQYLETVKERKLRERECDLQQQRAKWPQPVRVAQPARSASLRPKSKKTEAAIALKGVSAESEYQQRVEKHQAKLRRLQSRVDAVERGDNTALFADETERLNSLGTRLAEALQCVQRAVTTIEFWQHHWEDAFAASMKKSVPSIQSKAEAKMEEIEGILESHVVQYIDHCRKSTGDADEECDLQQLYAWVVEREEETASLGQDVLAQEDTLTITCLVQRMIKKHQDEYDRHRAEFETYYSSANNREIEMANRTGEAQSALFRLGHSHDLSRLNDLAFAMWHPVHILRVLDACLVKIPYSNSCIRLKADIYAALHDMILFYRKGKSRSFGSYRTISGGDAPDADDGAVPEGARSGTGIYERIKALKDRLEGEVLPEGGEGEAL